MLLLTGGFVLGEVVILHQGTMKELAPLLAVALVLCVAAVRADRRRQLFWGRSLGIRLLPLFMILGLTRGYWEERTARAEQALALDTERVSGVGEICGITEKENWNVLLLKNIQTEEGSLRYLQVYEKRTDGGSAEYADPDRPGENADGQENLEFYGQGAHHIGDVVQVRGEFAQFQEAANPGEFDYAVYYRGQKLVWRVFAQTVRNVEMGGISDVFPNAILCFRSWAAERLKLLAGEEDGSIFAAMLLGDKTGMSEEIRDLYQKNGIAHLLAVSGLHLSLVSMAAYGMLRKAGAGYGRSAVIGGLVLIAYSILTGASPSVIRALIMTLCGFLAAYLGRTYDLLSAMGLSALLLLWHSPYLVDQAGVQLSFAAIGGIGLAKELEDGTRPGGENLRLTLCMQLVSLPVVLWHFFSYPLYGIFLNLLVVPLTGILVGSGAGGLFASLFAFRAGVFVTGSGRAVLAWYALCCRWFMKLPGSSFLCGRPELWQIVAYYMALGILLSGIYGKLRGKKEIILIFFLLASLLVLRVPAVRGLEVTILDTGQGDGICIQTKNEVILVDGGSTDQKELGKYRLEPFLRSKGIRQIDLAIVTHGDWDHISGLSWLMEQAAEAETGAASGNIWVKTLVMPEAGRGEETYERLRKLCEQQGGQVVWIARGAEIKRSTDNRTDGSTGVQKIMGDLERRISGKSRNVLHLECLYPEFVSGNDTVASGTDRNEHSLVFRLDYGAFHMLLTGDMSADGEAKLLALESGKAQNSEKSADRAESADEPKSTNGSKSTNESKTDGFGTKRSGKGQTEAEEIWVLKVAHHGSGYSSSEEFLAWLRPDYAVISCGAKNRYGHPHPDTIRRLSDCNSEILQTKEHGAVIWKTDGHRVMWKGWKAVAKE